MGSAEASGPTPEEPLILLHAWQLLWVSLRHRWLIFLQYLRWKELTAQAREAAKDQRFFIWCSVRSWTGSAPDPRQRSSWVLGPGCLQSGAWRLLVPAPKTDAGTAMPSELRVQATLGESPDLLMPRGLLVLSVLPPGLLQKSLSIQTSHRATPHPYLRNGPHGEGARVSAASSGSPAQEEPSPAPIVPH